MKSSGIVALLLSLACLVIAACMRLGVSVEGDVCATCGDANGRSTPWMEIPGLASNQVQILATFGDTTPQIRGDQISGVIKVLSCAIQSGCGTSRIDRVSLEKLIGEPIDTIHSEPFTMCASYEAGTHRNPSKVLVIIYENGYVRSYGSGDLLRNAP